MSVVITVFIMRKRNQVSRRHSGNRYCYVKILSQVTIIERDYGWPLGIKTNLLSGIMYEQKKLCSFINLYSFIKNIPKEKETFSIY